MAGKTLTDVVRDLGRSMRLRENLTLPDAELLDRYVRHRDEAAFEALLHRHASMVFGVCRRLLHDVHDAEDAFQATFLVLARKAGVVVPPALVGNWLYGVAFRVAADAGRSVARRRVREQRAADLNEVPSREKLSEPDLAPLLHAEVERLPDKYRGPVLLCYLEGKTNEEAARQLQWPIGTLKIRLSRARELLRSRLARRVSLNRKVTLKVLSGGLGLTEKAVRRFRRESDAAAKLHHTDLLRLLVAGLEFTCWLGSYPCFVLCGAKSKSPRPCFYYRFSCRRPLPAGRPPMQSRAPTRPSARPRARFAPIRRTPTISPTAAAARSI
jgi:RNA polymerase sigma factor (sigma-70 family)